jgi:hypothetical protein
MANVVTRRDEYTFLGSGCSIVHTNTTSKSSGSTTSLFYRDLGARWQHDDSRWRPKARKTFERGLEDLHGERPSIIIRSGKGWECSASGACNTSALAFFRVPRILEKEEYRLQT